MQTINATEKTLVATEKFFARYALKLPPECRQDFILDIGNLILVAVKEATSYIIHGSTK